MYIWKDKQGNKLTPKQFLSRWKEGVEGTTPLQQTKISLWSFLPLFGGITWGLVTTFLGRTYWLTLILCGSLPLTSIQFLSTWQKYKKQKLINETMMELNGR